jgi:hypothetical protein
MKIVTVLCTDCNSYFDIEAMEPADLANPVCFDCQEKRECEHEHVRIERKGVGRCTETGYDDDSELIICCDCGHQEVA